MTFAYDNNMVFRAQNLVAVMIDFSVHGLEYGLDDFYNKFLDSKYSSKIESGDSSTIMGMSGIELACNILEIDEMENEKLADYELDSITTRSPEYWIGWAVAYYQWKSTLSFREINMIRSISDMKLMYHPYHEMDIEKFCDKMKELYLECNEITRLKKARTNIGISQRELSEITGIPVKTIQQYEQRQKNINHARVDYLISLSKALNCDIELLVEKV